MIRFLRLLIGGTLFAISFVITDKKRFGRFSKYDKTRIEKGK